MSGMIRAKDTLRAELADVYGDSLIGKIRNELTGAKSSTVKEHIFGTVPSLLDFMTPAEKLAVKTNTWTTVTNVSDAIDLALAAWPSLRAEAGVYRIIRPMIAKVPKFHLFGDGSGVTEFQVADGYTGVAWGGQTRTSMFWYQPAGAYDINTGFVIGGVISGMTLNCARYCDGIILNRVNQAQAVRDVHIYNPINGIENTFGWCHTYENVYVQGAQVISIILGNGSNGCSINGCFLFGNNFTTDRTQIHIDVNTGSAGNTVSGGAIEICEAGIRTTGRGQIAVNGTDFEEVAYRFGQHYGTYSGATLTEAGATSTYQGCNFVGAPSGGGIVTSGAGAVVDGGEFQNYDAYPAGVDQYALYGIQAGQNLTGLPGMGVSAKNCVFFGWGDNVTGRIKKGVVSTSYVGELCAEDIRVPLGNWTPVLTGFTTTGTVNIQDAKIVKMGNLVTFSMQIQATTIATTALTSTITGLPFAPSIASAVNAITGSVTNQSAALVYPNGSIYLPDKAAWGNSLIVSGSYFTNQ
jgi:hypothetical protein